MKPNLVFRKGLWLSAILLVPMAACQKVFDYIYLPGNGDAVTNICQVSSIESDAASYVFNYNSKGDLESIITNKLNTGNPNLFFTYDRRHRAVEVLSGFMASASEAGAVWFYHKLGYNTANQIVRDTVYQFGGKDADGIIRSSFHNEKHSLLQYDAGNRLVKATDSVWERGVYIYADYFTYKYNATGNLEYMIRESHNGPQFGGSIYSDTFRMKPYDTKLGIRRTSRIWMYLDRNYSVNNSFTSASYNSYGLPVQFNAGEYWYGFMEVLPAIGGNATVSYHCN